MMLKKVSDPQKRKFTTSETVLLVIMSLVIGLSIGRLLGKTNIITKKSIISNEHIKELVNNYEYILNNYYDDISEQNLVNSAINGMMESLDDPYSMYFNEVESENFEITLDGSYKGVGIQINKSEETGNILIVTVFKNSPASIAGLQAGDEIIEIDGILTKNYTSEEFSNLVKKSNKDSFELKILRDEEEKKVILKRSIVTLDSVSSKIYEKNEKKIGYIYIGIFANNTYFSPL